MQMNTVVDVYDGNRTRDFIKLADNMNDWLHRDGLLEVVNAYWYKNLG